MTSDTAIPLQHIMCNSVYSDLKVVPRHMLWRVGGASVNSIEEGKVGCLCMCSLRLPQDMTTICEDEIQKLRRLEQADSGASHSQYQVLHSSLLALHQHENHVDLEWEWGLEPYTRETPQHRYHTFILCTHVHVGGLLNRHGWIDFTHVPHCSLLSYPLLT